MKRLKLIALSLLFVVTLLRPNLASADEVDDACGQTAQNQVSALIQAPADVANVYVRAMLPEDERTATLYFQPFSLEDPLPCTTVGTVTLTKSWQKIGSFNPDLVNLQGLLTLALKDSTSSGVSASAPQAILTSETPPCALGSSCSYDFNGSAFELSPKKLSASADTLRVGYLTDPVGKDIKQVIYSIDGVQAYSKPTLEAFNERYVPGGEHSLERTVVFTSGEALSDKRTVKKGIYGDIGYFFTSFYTKYTKLFLYVALLVVSFMVWLLALAIGRRVHRRRLWKMTHIASVETTFDPSKAGVQPESEFNDSISTIIKKHKKIFIVLGSGVTLVFIISSFVLTVFTVDGLSMYPTLQDKSKKPLLTFPVLLGKITSSGYTPSRGTIVVIQKDDNNLFDDEAVKQKSYVVKRVIALPEERVAIKDGVVMIFNKENPNGFVPDDEYKWVKEEVHEYTRLDVTLKQNELFVLGDNRDESIDSRFYGPIQSSQLVGKVL